MEVDLLLSYLVDGRVGDTLQALLEEEASFSGEAVIDLRLLMARWRSLEKAQMRRELTRADYLQEFSTIHVDVQHFVRSQLSEDPTEQRTAVTLQQLCEEFSTASTIQNTAGRLRAKNTLSRKIAKHLLELPSFDQLDLQHNAIICGVSRKIMLVPDYGDLTLLSQMLSFATGGYVKGCMVNALAELVHDQKLNIGDEVEVRRILDKLSEEADEPLQANIQRVQVALDYLLTGERKQTNKLTLALPLNTYEYDAIVGAVAKTLVESTTSGSSTITDIRATLNRLFNRMTFRGEPTIEQCQTQRWSKRVQAAILTHHLLVNVESYLQSQLSSTDYLSYQDLLLSLSRYIDSMLAGLFERTQFDEGSIRHLLGSDDFMQALQRNGERRFSTLTDTILLDMPEPERLQINRHLSAVVAHADALFSRNK